MIFFMLRMNLVTVKGASSQFVEYWVQREPLGRDEEPFLRKKSKEIANAQNEEGSG
tara:strand:- start:261 stop:428 length:168 start_codon:yes stop_codon:yes gene_type:complete